jgi:hypothetical protein
MGLDPARLFGPQLERAVRALERVADGVEKMGAAADAQRELIEKATVASDGEREPVVPVSLVGRKPKPKRDGKS